MSQQPGYPPQQPYGASSYPASPYQKPNTGTNVAVIVIGVVVVSVLMVCGGLVAVGFIAVKAISDAVDDYARHQEREGGPRNPIEVAEGEAFTIGGMTYGAGWRVKQGRGAFEPTITGMRAENHRDDHDSASVEILFTFLVDTEEIGEIACSSDGTIGHGHAQALTCDTGAAMRNGWESIEVAARF